MVCFEDEDVLALIDPSTPAARLSSLHAHLDECPACRMLVAAVAHRTVSSSRTEREDTTLPGLDVPVAAAGYPRLAAGDLVDRYQLEQHLGEGGSGIVWAATHVELGKRVAVKLLKSSVREHAQRFVREARISASLRHPNIVEVHDIRTLPHGDGMVMVMELLEGTSLRHHLEHSGALALHEVAQVFGPVCDALGAAHAAGVVHRDLKPENVFLAREAGRIVPKILDFGLAKVTVVEEQVAGLTKSGALLGTPHYMAPEQISGARDVDARADVWSLGVMLWECLAGARPFEGRGHGPLFRAITALPLPSLSSAAPELPEPLLAVITASLDRDPAQRPTPESIAAVLRIQG